jgi:hypothetical protein
MKKRGRGGSPRRLDVPTLRRSDGPTSRLVVIAAAGEFADYVAYEIFGVAE